MCPEPTTVTAGRRVLGLKGQVVSFVALCGVGIAVVVGWAIVPTHRQLQRLHREIADLELQIQEQEALEPFAGQFRRAPGPVPDALPDMPAPSRLPRSRVPEIPSLFADMGSQAGLEHVFAVPEGKSVEDDYARLRVNISTRGEFGAFRDFMASVIKAPYTLHLESAQISRNGRQRELHMAVWVGIE